MHSFACNIITTLFILRVSGSTNTKKVDQNQVFDAILNNTEYDLRRRPYQVDDDEAPVVVQTSVYMYFLGHVEDAGLQFETMLMVRHHWRDDRLAFENANMSGGEIAHVGSLEGERWFTDRIWTPSVFIENEHSSLVTGLLREHKFVRISRTGDVELNYRVSAIVFCNMDLRRFPHDKQYCSVRLESWTLRSDDMILTWSTLNPLQLNKFDIPGFSLVATSTTARNSCYTDNFPSPRQDEDNDVTQTACDGIMEGRNYSMIFINFVLKRQIGHYLLNYYIPSILLVCISWVSFWLHPNATPARVTLGTTTWLTFITLTHSMGMNNLPDMNYIKYLDIWFLLCTLFIITSLLEFAIVNSISRNLETFTVRNRSASGIIPAAASIFATRAVQKKATPSVSASRKGHDKNLDENPEDIFNRRASIFSFDSVMSNETGRFSPNLNTARELSIRRISLADEMELPHDEESCNDDEATESSESVDSFKEKTKKFGINFEDMPSEDIAIWVDMKARIFFPVVFVVFNLFYWFFAGRADCALFYECDREENQDFELY